MAPFLPRSEIPLYLGGIVPFFIVFCFLLIF